MLLHVHLLLRVMVTSSLLLLWGEYLFALLLLLLRGMWGLGSERVAIDLNLFLQIVVIFTGCLCLVVGHHLRSGLLLHDHSLASRHHTLPSSGAATTSSINQGALRADGGCRPYLGLRAGRLLHWGLEVVHVARGLVDLLNCGDFVSALGSFWNVEVARGLNLKIWILNVSYILIMPELGPWDISIALTLPTEQIQPLLFIDGSFFISQYKLLLRS